MEGRRAAEEWLARRDAERASEEIGSAEVPVRPRSVYRSGSQREANREHRASTRVKRVDFVDRDGNRYQRLKHDDDGGGMEFVVRVRDTFRAGNLRAGTTVELIETATQLLYLATVRKTNINRRGASGSVTFTSEPGLLGPAVAFVSMH